MLALNIMLRWVRSKLWTNILWLMMLLSWPTGLYCIAFTLNGPSYPIIQPLHHNNRNTYINILPAWFYISIINIFFNKNKASFHNCLLHVFLWHIFPGQKPSIFPVKYKQEWIKILWKFLLIILQINEDELFLHWTEKRRVWERDHIHKYFILAIMTALHCLL